MKMTKLLTFIFILSLVYSSFSFSQTITTNAIPSGTARFEALGYNPFIMDAAIDLNRNPAWGRSYQNYIFGDVGRFGTFEESGGDDKYNLRDQYAGVNFKLGRQWSGGFILNKQEGQIFGGSIRNEYEFRDIQVPIVPFKGIITYSSGKLSIGLAPYYARWSEESVNFIANGVTLDKSSDIVGATIGLLHVMSSNKGWSDFSVDVMSNGYKSERDSAGTANDVTYENDGGLELNASYKGWYKMGSTSVNLVPYLNFSMFNWDPTRIPAFSTTSENKFLSITGGIGINLPIAGDGMFAGGISGGYVKNEFTQSDTSFTSESQITNLIFPQFNLGVEWNLTDFLQGRVGYSRAVMSEKFGTFTSGGTTSSAEIKELLASNPDQTITLGLGWQFDRFSLDGLIGERFFQQGPNVLSGKDNDLYGVLSMSYNFFR